MKKEIIEQTKTNVCAIQVSKGFQKVFRIIVFFKNCRVFIVLRISEFTIVCLGANIKTIKL